MKTAARIAIWFTALCLTLVALTVPVTQARAESSRYISDDDSAGYVDVSDIGLNRSVFSFTATIAATRGSVRVNPLYWSAKAADGTMYTTPDYSNTTLRSGNLPAGERARGTVAFEIDGPRPTLIALEGVLGERLATWTFSWREPKPAPRPRPSPFGS